MKDNAKGFQTCSGSSRFVVVDTVLLCVPLSNVPDLVALDGARVIPLSFTDQFATHRTASGRDGRPGDKDVDLKIFETLKFFASTSYPVFFLTRSKSLIPRGIISSIGH